MNITQLKVFGERNTGTNWVESILMKNYDIPIIHHRGIIAKLTTDDQKAVMRSLHIEERKFMRERLTDAIFENQSIHLFGWKHSCVKRSVLKKYPNFNETGFIFLVKHPYSFIKSLHRRPYHALLEVPVNIDEFVSSPWLTVHRDFINKALLKTPIELWNYKVSSYFNFMGNNKNALLLRYEEILNDPGLLFDSIYSQFSVKEKSRLTISKSTKKDKLETDDYKDKYLNTSPANGLNSHSIKLMRKVIESQLAEKCNYEI